MVLAHNTQPSTNSALSPSSTPSFKKKTHHKGIPGLDQRLILTINSIKIEIKTDYRNLYVFCHFLLFTNVVLKCESF